MADIPAGATLTSRFGVRQKTKIRPIDDCKSSFVNSSVTQSETISVHIVDHIAALVSCTESRGRPIQLMSKTWDRADAYKQVPLSDAAYDLDAYLVVYCPEARKPEALLGLMWSS